VSLMSVLTSMKLSFPMVRSITWRTLTLVVLTAGALPARAGEAYQVATISGLLAGGYEATRPSTSCCATAISDWAPSMAWMAR
jgi:hypothetical protein